MAVTPQDINPKQHRPLKEIAADIAYFPLDKDPGVPFDSSMRTSPDDHIASNMITLIDGRIEFADETHATFSPKNTLFERLTKPDLPDLLDQEPSPLLQLSYSVAALTKFREALLDLAASGKNMSESRIAIEKSAVQLTRMLADAFRQEEKGIPLGNLFDFDPRLNEGHKKSSHDSAEYFGKSATNIEKEVLPLVEELLEALKAQRSIKDIALDILHYPMDHDPKAPFDSSMRKSGEKDDNFENHLAREIKDADSMYGNKPVEDALLDKFTHRANTLSPEPISDPYENDLERILGHKKIFVKQVRDALRELAGLAPDKAKSSDEDEPKKISPARMVIEKRAFPIIDLCERVEDLRAQESLDTGPEELLLRGHSGHSDEEARKIAQEGAKEYVRYYVRRADNIQKGIKPLLEELAKAMELTLDKGIIKS